MNTPFDFLKNCYSKELPVTTEKNQFNSYFPVIRMLSFYPNMLRSMTKVSMLQAQLPESIIGCLLYNLVPKIKYLPKSSKYISAKSVTAEESAELETIKKVFCVNTKHGLQLVKILKQQKINLGEKGRKRKIK